MFQDSLPVRSEKCNYKCSLLEVGGFSRLGKNKFLPSPQKITLVITTISRGNALLERREMAW